MFKVSEVDKHIPVYRSKEIIGKNGVADTFDNSRLYEFTYNENDPNEKRINKRKYKRKPNNNRQIKFNFGNPNRRQPLRSKKTNLQEVNSEFKRETRSTKKRVNKVEYMDRLKCNNGAGKVNEKNNSNVRGNYICDSKVTDIVEKEKLYNSENKQIIPSNNIDVISTKNLNKMNRSTNSISEIKNSIKPILKENNYENKKQNLNSNTSFHVHFENSIPAELINERSKLMSEMLSTDGFSHTDFDNQNSDTNVSIKNKSNRIKFSNFYAAEFSNIEINEYDNFPECYWDTVTQNAFSLNNNVDDCNVNTFKSVTSLREPDYINNCQVDNRIVDSNTLFGFDEKTIDFNAFKTTDSDHERKNRTVTSNDILSKDCTFFGFDDESSIERQITCPAVTRYVRKSDNHSNKQCNGNVSFSQVSSLLKKYDTEKEIISISSCKTFLGFDESSSELANSRLILESKMNCLCKIISEMIKQRTDQNSNTHFHGDDMNPSSIAKMCKSIQQRPTSRKVMFKLSDLQTNTTASSQLDTSTKYTSNKTCMENVFNGTEKYFIFSDKIDELIGHKPRCGQNVFNPYEPHELIRRRRKKLVNVENKPKEKVSKKQANLFNKQADELNSKFKEIENFQLLIE